MEDSIEIITTTTIETGTEPVSLMPSSERVSMDSKPNFTMSDEESEKSSSNNSKKKKHKKNVSKKIKEMQIEDAEHSEHSEHSERDPEEGHVAKKKKKSKQNKFLKFFSNLCCSPDGYVYSLLKLNFFMRALKFLPALLITYGIELFNSANLGSNQAILSNHFSLLIFEPVLSAIAGNIGLQTSSSVSSYINLQILNKRKVRIKFLAYKYLIHNFFLASFLSILMGFTCYIWPKDPGDNFAEKCRIQHAIIIFFSAYSNMIIASIAGLFTPVIMHTCKYDPSSGAGPFETALQDVVGAVFFVLIAKAIISGWPNVFIVTPATNCTLY